MLYSWPKIKDKKTEVRILNPLLTKMHTIVKYNHASTWRSFWGFQSESNIITVSAVARLIPRPPALVERRKQKSSLPGALKWSIACWRNSAFVLPSSLWNWNPLSDIYSASISSILTICKSMWDIDSESTLLQIETVKPPNQSTFDNSVKNSNTKQSIPHIKEHLTARKTE